MSLLRLSRVQHLISRFRGELTEGVTDEAIIERLHPTPAVGGVPVEKARRSIQAIEPFDRGWYAGPVGWVGFDQAEFAVAIRSALVTNGHVRLFSGAGIVHGSTPEREWGEMESKISSFLAILAGQ